MLLEEHFSGAAGSGGHISWRLKTVQRKIRCGSPMPPESSMDTSPRDPNLQRTVNVERRLDGDACQEAMSSLNRTTDNSVIFQMRGTFHHRQKLVNDPGRGFLVRKGFVSKELCILNVVNCAVTV